MRSDDATPPPPPPPPEASQTETPASAPAEARFVEPRRLHPASVLLGVNLTQAVQALVVPTFATIASGSVVLIGVYAVFLVVALITRILAWQRFEFSFDGEVVRVDSGVLSRNHRSVDVARIQQVEIQRGVVARMLGLAALSIETAGGAGETEVELRVLPDADAVALRAALRASKARLEGRTTGADHGPDGADAGADVEASDDDGELILAVPMRHVVLAAVTGAQLLVFPAVVGGAFQFVGQQIEAFLERATDELLERGIADASELFTAPGWPLVLAVAGGAFVLSVLFAIVVGVFRDGQFRIERVDDDLHVHRGLVSTHDSVVPLRRIQVVEVRRNWLRRPLGYTSVRIHSAGGSVGDDRRVTVPLVPDVEVDRLLQHLLPGVEGIPPLRPHPPAALRRAMFRWLRPAVGAVAVVWLVLPHIPWGWLATAATQGRWIILGLVPLNAILAVIEYRHLGHALTERIVVARRGALSLTTSIAPVVKVQAVTTEANPFQRRLGLANLSAHVAGPGGDIDVLDAGSDDAKQLHARLTEHAASPTAVGPEVSAADDTAILADQ